MVEVRSNGAVEWLKVEDEERMRNELDVAPEEDAQPAEEAFDIFWSRPPGPCARTRAGVEVGAGLDERRAMPTARQHAKPHAHTHAETRTRNAACRSPTPPRA